MKFDYFVLATMSLSSWSSSEKLQEDSKGGTYKALNWFAFGLEVLGGIIVVITAIYLRYYSLVYT